jgi:hypothetical protein
MFKKERKKNSGKYYYSPYSIIVIELFCKLNAIVNLNISAKFFSPLIQDY